MDRQRIEGDLMVRLAAPSARCAAPPDIDQWRRQHRKSPGRCRPGLSKVCPNGLGGGIAGVTANHACHWAIVPNPSRARSEEHGGRDERYFGLASPGNL